MPAFPQLRRSVAVTCNTGACAQLRVIDDCEGCEVEYHHTLVSCTIERQCHSALLGSGWG